MKTLFFYYRYPLYPKGSYFQEFLDEYCSCTEQVYLVATRYPKGDFEKPENLKILWVPSLPIGFLNELWYSLFSLCLSVTKKELKKVDITNSIGPRGLLAGWFLKGFCKIPLVCTVELLPEGNDLTSRIVFVVSKVLFKAAPVDKFISWSRYYRDKYLVNWGVPKESVEIISGGIDTESFHPRVSGQKIKDRYSPDAPLIVFAKPLYKQNTESAKILVSALNILLEDLSVNLLIGGGKGKEDVVQLASDFNVEDHVMFMDPTPFPEIPNYLAAADLIVLPFSYAPTTSRSLFEAMAMGKPVVTISIGEIIHILEHEKDALLASNNAHEIARAIKRILNTPGLSRELAKNARNKVVKKYSQQAVVYKTKSVFESLNKFD